MNRLGVTKFVDIVKHSVDGNVFWYEKKNKILFDREKRDFYGIISDDFKVISPIPKELVDFLTEAGYSVRDM